MVEKSISRVLHPHTSQEFQEIIKNLPNLVLIDFFATWCGPCRNFSPMFDQMSLNYPNVTFIKIDVDKMPEVSQMYGVEAMPSFQFLKAGEKIGDIIRGADVNRMQETIKLNDKLLTAEQYKSLGNFFLQKMSNVNESLHWYSSALNLFPNDPVVSILLSNRIQIWLKQQDYVKAYKDSSALIRFMKKNSTSNFFKGFSRHFDVLMKLGKHRRAKEFVKDLLLFGSLSKEEEETVSKSWSQQISQISVLPKTAEEMKTQGNKHFKENKMMEAIFYYSQAICAEPSDCTLFTNRALVLLKLNEFELAIEDCEDSLNIEKNVKAYTLMGMAAKAIGRQTVLQECIQKGLEMDATNEKLINLQN